jgi:hypothetical protein
MPLRPMARPSAARRLRRTIRRMRVGHSTTYEICNQSSNSQLAPQQHKCAPPPTANGYEVCRKTLLSEDASHQHQHESDTPDPQANVEDVSRLFERASLHHQTAFNGGYSPAHLTTLDQGTDNLLLSTEMAHHQHKRDSLAHQAKIDCKYCSRSFPTTATLYQHRCDSPTPEASSETDSPVSTDSTASPASPATIVCKYCDRSFSTTVTLHQHRCEQPTYTTSDRRTRHQASLSTFDSSFSDGDAPSQPTPWSLQPAFHDDVSQLLHPVLSVEFFEASGFHDCIELHDTHILGRFTCTNMACRKEWSSQLVALTIRLYSGKRYNAVVWHQRCRSCEHLGLPTLDDTYAERVAYRLKVWFRKPVEPVYYSARKTAPHEFELCEGCKNRHCKIGLLTQGRGQRVDLEFAAG